MSHQIQWEGYIQKNPDLARHRQTLLAVSERLPLEKFTALPPQLQNRLAKFAESRLRPTSPPASICWAPGTSMEVMEAFHAVEEMSADPDFEVSAATQFSDNDRWARTATFTSRFERGEQGLPTTLTWSFVPDGTSIFGFNGEPTSDSNLIVFLDARYNVTNGGSDLTTRPWFAIFQAAFDNIASLTGVSYFYEPNDDGAAFTQNSLPSGQLGVRGDVRISGHFIDGESGSNTLAYNFNAGFGDMVIDTGNPSFYGNLSSDSLNLRNVVEHEHGHGLGLGHVCPVNQTKLMEPFISRNFRGLQLDDIFSLNRLYGDFYEKHSSSRNNDTSSQAATLPVTPGIPFQRDYLSIDDGSDTDFYRLQNVPAGSFVTCRVIPVGTPAGFVEGPQNTNGSCSSGTSFNFTNVHDLSLELRSSNGSQVLASANATPAGGTEEIPAFEAQSGGTYFLRVAGDNTDSTQLYTLEIEINLTPISPSGLIATNPTPDTVELTWSDNSTNETGFLIERKIESDGPWLAYDTTLPDQVSYLDPNPIPGTNLFYRITAQGGSTNSGPTSEVTTMTVNLSSTNYLYDLGGPVTPLAAGAFRISPLTNGSISWNNPVDFRDRETTDPADRDYLFSSEPRTLSHRISNDFWEVTIRQGDATTALEELTVSAEGVIRAGGISPAAGEFIDSAFVVEVTDGTLDLTFDDLGGATDTWVVNRIELRRLTPFESWAVEEMIPSSLAAPTDDADEDGLANLQEYYFGLSPINPDPANPVTSALSPDGSSYLFSFPRDPGASIDTVIFETSTDLDSWSPFSPLPNQISVTPDGDKENVTITLPTSSDQIFLRLGLTQSN